MNTTQQPILGHAAFYPNGSARPIWYAVKERIGIAGGEIGLFCREQVTAPRLPRHRKPVVGKRGGVKPATSVRRGKGK
jgi:hypothetical protein